MANEIAVDSFLNLLGQSELVTDDQFVAIMEEFRGEETASKSTRELADQLVKREVLTAWQAEMLLQGKHRGFRLGPYRILRPLGQGGMSKVFLAEHETMRRRSAIKVLPSKYEGDADLLNRFQLEAVAVAHLDHPNIVRAYDFNKDMRYGREIHYLVMEYVEGLDLRRMVEEQGPLDFRKAAEFIAQAAEGLTHAHAAGFVHRDIKPANLLVDPHGVLKILDLGLAMFTVAAQLDVGPGEGEQSAVGTADYAAPEQVVDSQNVDGRADIYGLGLTFYFVLTGRRPFSKPTVMELLMAHRTEKPEAISKFRPDVPFELEAIIDKMTAKLPQQRYQTAKEVAEKLRTWLQEAGSRSYSRISALMAEAARAKQQPSGGEAAKTSPTPTEDKEFELAAIEDESAAAPKGTEAKNTENGAVKTAPTAAPKDKNHQPAAKKPVAPQAKKPPPISRNAPPEPLTQDLLAALPPTMPSAMGVPAGFRRQRKLNWLLRSPWLGIGLAGAALLGLLVFLVVLFTSSTPEPRHSVPGPTEARQTPPSIPRRPPSQKPTEPPRAVATIPALEHSTPPVPKSPATQKKEATKTAPGKATRIPLFEEKQKTSGKAPPSKPADMDALLAGLTEVSCRLRTFDAQQVHGRLGLEVYKATNLVLKRLGLSLVENADAAMDFDITLQKDKNWSSIVLSVELTCSDKDGARVTAWKGSGKIVSCESNKLPEPGVRTSPQLTRITAAAKTNANKFLDTFAEAVRQARSKVKPK